MLDESTIKRVLNAALKGGGEVAELFVEDRSATSMRLEDSRVENVSSGRDSGAGIRVIAGERASYAYTNLLTEDGLVEAAKTASAGLGGPGEVKEFDLRRVEAPVEHPVRIRPEDVDTADKVNALLAADEAARATSGEVRQVVASYADIRQKVLIAASDGRFAEDDRTRLRMVCQVVAARDGRIQTGVTAPGHSGGFEMLEEHPAAKIGSKAAETAVRMLDAKPSPAGQFTVVLAPGPGGVLIHEACGHGLEADTLVKHASVYADRQGERFGSDIVTIVDDGTEVGSWGSSGVDDEATPAQRTVLFDKGILVGHISDVRSAEKIGHPPTGNGRRQSYAHIPLVRMTNTYLMPGPDDPEEILRSVKRGVYAVQFAGGEVNPATGNFVFGMSEAYMIENGEITYPIKGAQLIGNGPKVLGTIEAVGPDLAYREGVCGKDGQHAPVTSGVPTVLLRDMTVGGTET